jgi:hypothetical protein
MTDRMTRPAMRTCKCFLMFWVLLAGCQQSFIYEYAVQVEAFGLSELPEQPATVVMTSSNPAKTWRFTLPGRHGVATVNIEHPIPRPCPPHTICDPAIWSFHVLVSRPGYESWDTQCAEGFVRVSDRLARRVDRVRLFPVPGALTRELREELSLKLPSGLGVYTRRWFVDVDKDGGLEALLYREEEQRFSSPTCVEIQVWSHRGGTWIPLFTADHRGVFFEGSPVPGTGPALFGYGFKNVGATTERMHLCFALCPLSEEGKYVENRRGSYVWRAGEQTFSMAPVTVSKPG